MYIYTHTNIYNYIIHITYIIHKQYNIICLCISLDMLHTTELQILQCSWKDLKRRYRNIRVYNTLFNSMLCRWSNDCGSEPTQYIQDKLFVHTCLRVPNTCILITFVNLASIMIKMHTLNTHAYITNMCIHNICCKHKYAYIHIHIYTYAHRVKQWY